MPDEKKEGHYKGDKATLNIPKGSDKEAKPKK
jgi:hypothetical protein